MTKRHADTGQVKLRGAPTGPVESKRSTRDTPARPVSSGDLTAEARIARGDAPALGPAVGIALWWSGGRDGVELPRAKLAGVASECGLPPSVLPATKTSYGHVTRAMRILSASGYTVVPTGTRGAWVVQKGGNKIATVTASPRTDKTPTITGDHAVKVKVLGEWTRLTEEQGYPASEVTLWLRGVLERRYHGVRIGPNVYFVPRAGAEGAERVTGALSRAGWGADWGLPGLPQPSTPALHGAIVSGLIAEVGEVRRELGWKRQEYMSKGLGDVAERAARGFQDRLGDTAGRALWLSDAVGIPTEPVKIAIVTLGDELEPLTRGGLTGSQIWAVAESMR